MKVNSSRSTSNTTTAATDDSGGNGGDLFLFSIAAAAFFFFLDLWFGDVDLWFWRMVFGGLVKKMGGRGLSSETAVRLGAVLVIFRGVRVGVRRGRFSTLLGFCSLVLEIQVTHA